MQTKKSYVIQIIFALIFILAFFMPWIERSILSIQISFTGINVPSLNERLTEFSNILHTFTPSGKESTKIGYVLYLVPILSIISIVLIFTMKRFALSKYVLFIAAILGVIFPIYVDIKVINTLGLTSIGMGSHLLLLSSLIYIALFFSPLMKKKQIVERV